MANNLEKWNFYKRILNRKSSEYIENIINDNVLDKFYSVDTNGDIHTNIIDSLYCAEADVGFLGRSPNNKDISRIKMLSNSDIVFSVQNIVISYYEIINEYKSISRIKYVEYIEDKDIFIEYEEAKVVSDSRKAKCEKTKAFIEANIKPSNYDYDANGYTFLGWENTWIEEPQLLKECRAKNHEYVETKIGRKGMDNTVSCPVCKIYWKYDCSD